MRKLIGLTDDELVEGVPAVEPLGVGVGSRIGSGLWSLHQLSDMLPGSSSLPPLRNPRRRLSWCEFEIRENRVKVVVFEPFLLVAIGRAQADAIAFKAHESDGPKPLVSLRRLDPFFDRSYGFAPEF